MSERRMWWMRPNIDPKSMQPCVSSQCICKLYHRHFPIVLFYYIMKYYLTRWPKYQIIIEKTENNATMWEYIYTYIILFSGLLHACENIGWYKTLTKIDPCYSKKKQNFIVYTGSTQVYLHSMVKYCDAMFGLLLLM